MNVSDAIWLFGLIFFLGICLGKLSRGMQPVGSGIAALLFIASLALHWLEQLHYSRIVALLALAVYGVTRYQHAQWLKAQPQDKSR